MSQLRLRLENQLIKRRDSNNRIKLKTVTKLADLTGRKWWPPLDTNSLKLHKATAKQEYYQLKNKISSIISTYLEERARQMAMMGNTAEEKHLHALIYTKNMREQDLRIRRLRPRQRGAGVRELTIEESI